MNYILSKMAEVGCGVVDTADIAIICDNLTDIERDTLDAMHNLGMHVSLTPIGSMTRANLISQFSDDDLMCLSAYVSARRNIEKY